MRDSFDPVLSVTIDGRQVTTGDFVSPNPVIEASLWDENIYLLKTDTTNVQFFLTYPCPSTDCDPVPVYFSRDDVRWFAATDTTDFRVVFTPKNLEEGEYWLQVSAADASGNESSDQRYEVMFVVDYEPTVSINPPYPNPFALTSVFQIKISGTSEPDAFSLIILDVNGKVVREMNDSNTTSLIIGTNEISWDGTTDGRAPVADGLYIFSMSLVVEGQVIQRSGKLVLAR